MTFAYVFLELLKSCRYEEIFVNYNVLTLLACTQAYWFAWGTSMYFMIYVIYFYQTCQYIAKDIKRKEYKLSYLACYRRGGNRSQQLDVALFNNRASCWQRTTASLVTASWGWDDESGYRWKVGIEPLMLDRSSLTPCFPAHYWMLRVPMYFHRLKNVMSQSLEFCNLKAPRRFLHLPFLVEASPLLPHFRRDEDASLRLAC